MDVKSGYTKKSSDRFVIFFILALLLILKEKRLLKSVSLSLGAREKEKAPSLSDCAFLFSRQEHRIIEPDLEGIGCHFG
jgi:hypothetical protein